MLVQSLRASTTQSYACCVHVRVAHFLRDAESLLLKCGIARHLHHLVATLTPGVLALLAHLSSPCCHANPYHIAAICCMRSGLWGFPPQRCKSRLSHGPWAFTHPWWRDCASPPHHKKPPGVHPLRHTSWRPPLCVSSAWWTVICTAVRLVSPAALGLPWPNPR